MALSARETGQEFTILTNLPIVLPGRRFAYHA